MKNASNLYRFAGLFFLGAAFLVVGAPSLSAQGFGTPAAGSEGISSSIKSAISTWYWFLYLLSPVTIYQAWQKYKEGDQKGFGAYIIATIGIFISPAIPRLFQSITNTAASSGGL